MFCIKTTNKQLINLTKNYNKLLFKVRDKNKYITFLKSELANLGYDNNYLSKRYKEYKTLHKTYNENFEEEEYQKSQKLLSHTDQVNMKFIEAKTEEQIRVIRESLKQSQTNKYINEVVQRYGFAFKVHASEALILNAPPQRLHNAISQESLIKFYIEKNRELNELLNKLKSVNIEEKQYSIKINLNPPQVVNNLLEKPYQLVSMENKAEIIKENVKEEQKSIALRLRPRRATLNYDYLHKFLIKLKEMTKEESKDESKRVIKKFKNDKDKQKYLTKLKDRIYMNECNMNFYEEEYRRIKGQRGASYLASYLNYMNPISWFYDTKDKENSRKEYQNLTEQLAEIESKIQFTTEEIANDKDELRLLNQQ